MMFAVAGAHSVPRRYASYPEEVIQGVSYAEISLGFIALLLVGILLFAWDTSRRCARALAR